MEKASFRDGMMEKFGLFIPNRVIKTIQYKTNIIGKLMYVINDAHLHGVTSLALTSDS